jgi:anti-sigma regulatory factor (Ser/Thr protein kinase)
LLTNIITHAFTDEASHTVKIEITCTNNRLSITISDDGAPFNPFTREDPDITLSLDEREVGGLGIHLVKNAMDETIYRRRHNRNVVTLIKNIIQ